MPDIPKVLNEDLIVERIYAAIKREQEESDDRKSGVQLYRMGASGLGNECLRATWYDWRGYSSESIDGRVHRLFQTGHLQEERIIADLRRAGYAVWDRQEDGRQFEYTDESGHFVCKLDGVITGLEGAEKTPHVLEIKTHNDKSFAELKKKGVAGAKPAHYLQMHAGMWLTGVHRGLYVALNKNDESYYIERIVLDPMVVEKIKHEIDALRGAATPPARAGDKPDSFVCKWCDHREVCWGAGQGPTQCRTCVSAIPLEERGEWACAMDDVTIGRKEQGEGCERWDPILFK